MSERAPHRLPTTVRPTHYDLELAPDLDAATFEGEVEITLLVTEPTAELVCHALDLTVDEAYLTGSDGTRLEATVSFDPVHEMATFTLSGEADAGAWTLHARFRGELNDKLVGFYRSTFTDDDGATRTIACTQFESTHARRAFPCWDEPAFKATYAIRLVVASDLFAVSNAAETHVDDLDDGRRRVHFAPTMSMSTYLVAFVVGPLEATDPIDVDGVPLRVIAPIGKARLTPFALDAGAFALRYLADWYDLPYPGDKLDLIAIPDFAFGAMENLGCVTFRETALLVDQERATQAELQRIADVVAHEIAHMWFGDLVTMGWWNGIWLNEAFATFMELMTVDAYRPDWKRWVDFGLSRTMAFDTDSLSCTRPIEYEVVTAADAEAMFDILTYEKGASVVRMLQQYLGEDRFQAGIRHYLRTHQFSNTETTDLWDAIEEAAGEPVRSIMDSWIFRAGHPVVAISTDGAGAKLTLEQSLFSYAADPAADLATIDPSPRAVPVVIRVGQDGAEPVIVRHLLDEPSATVDLPAPATWIVGNHEGNGFYRVALRPEDLAAVAARAAAELDPLERYGLIEDTWSLLLAGRADAGQVLGVLRSLASDDDLSVWQRSTGVLSSFDRFAGPHRDALAAWTRALVAPALLRLGDEPSPEETERTGALRATLFESLCRTGRDTAGIQLAADRFEALAGDPTAVDPDLADAVVRVVALDAEEGTWDELRRRASAAATPQDRLRHQGALADASDRRLVERFCGLVLTDEVRTQDGLFLLRRALANRHASDLVWAFVVENWDAITTRFPSQSVPRLIDGIRTIGDRGLAGEVAGFLAEHPIPQGRAVVGQHLERMWVSVALADRLPPQLGDALA